MWSPLATCKKGFSMDDFKTNYSVARVVTHTRDNISKFEKHNARKNETYSNMNVALSQTPNNVYYKNCDTTLNEKVKEMVTKEQKELKEKINELTITLDENKQEEIDLTTFIGKVRKYTNIKELTPEIINELIDKILVYQQTKLNGKKYQQIDIYYAGVGIISIPTNEYELETAFQKNHRNTKTA